MRHEILRMLENNSRIDLHDLAIMLGTDESVVLEEIEKMEENGTFEVLPKKEVIQIKKEYEKLNKLLGGIREMAKSRKVKGYTNMKKDELIASLNK